MRFLARQTIKGFVLMVSLSTVVILTSIVVLNAQPSTDQQNSQSPVQKRIDIIDDSFGRFTTESTTIVQGGWGAAEGEFGLFEPQGEGEKEGPMSYCVDGKSNVYVLDQVNLRVQKFGPQGNFVSAIPIDNRTADRILVDSNENVYVFDLWCKREVAAYNNIGELIQKMSLNVGENTTTGGISEVFVQNDDIYAEDAETGRMYELGSAGTILEFHNQRSIELPGRFQKGTGNHLYLKPSNDGAVVDIVEREGKLNTSIAFNSKRKVHNYVELTSDSSGNIYLGAYLVKQSGLNFVDSQFSFIKATRSGEILGKAEMPTNLYVPTRHPFYVTDDGNLYQLQTLKDGLRVVKWQI